MSTRFEKKIIMPNGTMGKTTLMDLSDEDIKSVERWHKKEWDEFRTEIESYKHKVLEASRSAYMRLWEKAQKCEKCRKRRAAFMKRFTNIKRQRGSIMLGANASSARVEGVDLECTATTSTIPNLSDFCIEPCVAYTRARLHSDGDWYWDEANSWGASDGTWQGSCAVADYDTQWNRVSGTVPNSVVSGSDGVWSAATTSKAVGYASNIGIDSGSFNLKCRDGTTLTELFTDSFTMSAETESFK